MKGKNYKVRHSESVRTNIIIFVVAFLIVTLSSNWKWALSISTVIFLVQYLKALRWDRIFIQSIVIDKGSVEIRYLDKEAINVIKGGIGDVIISKEVALSKIKTVYMAVYYQGIKLKQFPVSNWDEPKFEEVVKAYDDSKANN